MKDDIKMLLRIKENNVSNGLPVLSKKGMALLLIGEDIKSPIGAIYL